MTKPSLLQVVKSVLSAAIGVQSDKNREMDFKHGSLPIYIIAGLILTGIFVFTVAKIATLVSGQ
jgi:hypothetical protein